MAPVAPRYTTKQWKKANNYREIFATKNYAVLNNSFAEILHIATNEETLRGEPIVVPKDSGGLGGKLKGLLKKR